MNVQTVFILLTVFTNTSTCVDCNIHTNTNGMKILPDFITCICSGIDSVFQWSSLESIQSDLLPFFPKIIFINCTTLVLDLVPPHPEPLPWLVLNNMKEVVMSVSLASMNISLSNVTSVQYIGQDWEDSDQMYLYLSIALGTLCVVLIIVLITASVIARIRLRNDPENKKVSRAESWRYEPSIYVKHPSGQKPVYVPPPLPPSSPESGPPTWSRPPNSLSSSPLLRTKYNSTLPGLRGVDIVRTSLPTQQERQMKNTYHGTPIASRELFIIKRNAEIESRESVNQISDTEDEHEEEQEGYEASTLPYR